MPNNLGTAWIQIKPSMKGITSSIRSELSGVGEGEGQSVGSKFTAGFAAKIGAISGIAQQVFSKAMSVVTSQISDAVNRADTLERFPKVMEMMGYSAEDASNAIQKLRDGVKGIPTSLADVVSGTQRLASITGDVDKAADWTLALSDAMLITTGDVNEASRGMQQFMQILARGKPAGDDWNTVMEVASPIMNELAKSLGYTSASLGGDFYTALQKGTLSVDDMMSALVELDRNGGNGLPSLAQRVKESTGGISATMTALKQSISNALVSIIQEIGSENIEAVINGIKDAIVGLLGIVKNFFIFAKENWDWLKYVVNTIVAFLAGAVIIKGVTKIIGIFKNLKTAVTGVFGKSTTNTVVKGAQNMFSGLGTAIKNALKSLKEILVSLAESITEPLKTLFKGVGEAIAGFFKALADPAIAIGAVMFALAAASIAAAILMIGGALGVVMPVLKDLFDNIIMPIAQFIADTVLLLISALTQAIVTLTNDALIPLGDFLVSSFVIILETISNTIINLTQGALIPLINTLSGAFTNVVQTVGNMLNNVIKTALEGIANVVSAVGDGFLKMGEAIKTALDGVSGVINAFADLIRSIASAAVAIVALVTGHSIDYGNGFAHLDGYALGGRVFGDGTPTSDSIPAMLSNGEYVIRASSAREIGYDKLDEMNENGRVAGGQTNYFTINGYNKSPEELATIISRKIAFNTRGVMG